VLASATTSARSARAVRPFARAVEHEELLAKQQVLGDQLRHAARQIDGRADQRGVVERLAPARAVPPDDPQSTLGHEPRTIPKDMEHQRGLLRELGAASRQRCWACRRLYQRLEADFDVGAVGREGEPQSRRQSPASLADLAADEAGSRHRAGRRHGVWARVVLPRY
jgi:hypothetical protein